MHVFSKYELPFLRSGTGLDHDMEYDSAFSIALGAISHLANLQNLATWGTDVKEMKDEKVCQYIQRIQNVGAFMYQILLK